MMVADVYQRNGDSPAKSWLLDEVTRSRVFSVSNQSSHCFHPINVTLWRLLLFYQFYYYFPFSRYVYVRMYVYSLRYKIPSSFTSVTIYLYSNHSTYNNIIIVITVTKYLNLRQLSYKYCVSCIFAICIFWVKPLRWDVGNFSLCIYVFTLHRF